MINPGTAPACVLCNSHRDANIHLAQYRYSGYHEYRAPLPTIDAPAIVQGQFPPQQEFPTMSTNEVVDLGDTEPRSERPPSTPCKYPSVVVELIGGDGNAFVVLAKVQKALRHAGVPRETISQYIAEATNGDYDHLLATTMQWVTVQ